MRYIFAALIISISFNSVAYAAIKLKAPDQNAVGKAAGATCDVKQAYEFLRGKTSGNYKATITKLDPEFACRLEKFFKAANCGQIFSAVRSKSDHARVSGNSNGAGRKGVNSFASSCHTYGLAVDVRGCKGKKAMAKQYKVHFPYNDTHMQCVEHVRPRCSAETKTCAGGVARKSIADVTGQGGGGAPPMDGGGGGGDGASAKKGGEGGGDSGGLGDILKSLAGLIKPKPKDPNQQNKDIAKKPICTTLTTGTQKPLIPGDSTTLSWVLDGGRADATIVSPGVGAVRGFSVQVAPRVSTTYTVTAINREGRSTCPKVRVYVGARGDIDIDNDVFSDNESSQRGDPIEAQNIWGEGLFTKDTGGQQQGGRQSAYDDIRQTRNGNIPIPQQSQEELDYYTLKNESGGEISEEQGPLAYADYYSPTKESGSNSLLEELIPSWYEGESQGEVIETNFFDDSEDEYALEEGAYFEDEATYDYGSVEGDWIDTDEIENQNNLTDEEIYGSWQAPRTGNFGYAGGRSTGGGASVDVSDGKQEESVGIITRLGRWIKSIFCFWCTT